LLDLIRLDAAIQDVAATPAQLKTLHACIKKVSEDLDAMHFNTAISALMVFVNDAMTWEAKPLAVLTTFLQLLGAVRAAPCRRTVELSTPRSRSAFRVDLCALAQV